MRYDLSYNDYLIQIMIKHLLSYAFVFSLILVLISRSTVLPEDQLGQIRAYTRANEFDFVKWTLRALANKNMQAALGAQNYLSTERQAELVEEYLNLVRSINQLEREVTLIYSDPAIEAPQLTAADFEAELERSRAVHTQLTPIVESILQHQVGSVMADMGLGAAGQPVPPVLYQVTDLPLALIVSPRHEIRQEYNISLEPEMELIDRRDLERQVEDTAGVSALVVPVGGIGIYPPMVLSTTHLPSLVDVIAHEWTHNYLTLRPLGVLYGATPQLRTMNETAASIAGQEIAEEVLRRFYPHLAPPPPDPAPQIEEEESLPVAPPELPLPFDARRVLFETRVQTDELLAEGKIEEAEAFMEAQREYLWENGYFIRRLNQAYFAFYGAYADVPGGAAGQDPVGPAVRELRARSESLAQFLDRISWMTSFETLQEVVATDL
jgi:hypothetical protein